MVLLHTKIYGQCSLKETVYRRVLVRWYQTYAQSIFNLPQLFSLLEGKKANVAKNKKYGFNLIGYDQGRLGLGEDLRSYMLLLQQGAQHLDVLYCEACHCIAAGPLFAPQCDPQ